MYYIMLITAVLLTVLSDLSQQTYKMTAEFSPAGNDISVSMAALKQWEFSSSFLNIVSLAVQNH